MYGLSRQDTLPAEDPSWSYSRVPGQPAPIPPRSEPLLYQASHDDSDVHAIALWCLKNLRTVKVHLPTPPANRESMNDDGTGSNVTVTNPDNSLGKDFVWPKPPFGLDNDSEALPLSAMAALTIHTSPQTSGVVATSSPILPQLGAIFNVSEKDGDVIDEFHPRNGETRISNLLT